MKTSLRFVLKQSLSFAALFIALEATAQAGAVSPEPADYALGFGAATVAFIVWRNYRRGHAQKGESGQ